jgi:RNA polymerase sigma-70 factor (ECF subfamily)
VTVAARPASPAPAAELDDVTLRRAVRGDQAAWRALIVRYERPVFALLSRMLGPGRRGQVEDLAQETFLHVVRAIEGFAPGGPAKLSTWILTIAARRAIDELRRRPVVPAVLEGASGERGDDALHRAQVAAAIRRAVADLSPEFRAAFLLREYHGLEYAEIATALAIDLGTVKSRLSRARAALRAALAEVHDE